MNLQLICKLGTSKKQILYSFCFKVLKEKSFIMKMKVIYIYTLDSSLNVRLTYIYILTC